MNDNREPRSLLSVGKLKCESRQNPIGIDEPRPRLSWQITSSKRSVMQQAYRIVVTQAKGASSHVIWDSDKVLSDQSVYIEYGGPALEPRQRYGWKVCVWDEDGNDSGWSEEAFWEMGLLRAEDWQAAWIEPSQQPVIREEQIDMRALFSGATFSMEGSFEALHPCPMLRKRFVTNGDIARARVYATAHGVYRLELNGMRVTDMEFAPEFTVYDQFLQYQTYDVTNLLQKGENAIGVALGDGWWAGRIGLLGDSCQFGDRLALLLQLEIEYCDGRTQTVLSDDSFKSSTGPLLGSDIFIGERYDARLEKPGWSAADFDDSAWTTVQTKDFGYDHLKAQCAPPVRTVETLRPATVIVTPDGDTVVDLGQNIAGRVRMRVQGERGMVVTLEHSETLDEHGNFIRNILGRNKNQTDQYILKGGSAEIFEPAFTYHGFRYVRVTGYPGTPTADDFTGVVLASDLPLIGSFECSDKRINRLQSNILWSQRANMFSIPTDCPQRERAGWTGDIQIFAPTACLNMDMQAFLERWLRSVRVEQRADGQIPVIVPYVLKNYDEASLPFPGFCSSTGWGDACIIVPWALYRAYGNKHMLQENYDAMVKWVLYLKEAAGRSGGDGYLLKTGFHFGDWLVPSICDSNGRPNSMQSAMMTKDPVSNCFFAYSCSLLNQIAGILGHREDETRYKALSANIKEAFAREYLSEDGRLKVHLQGVYVLALAMDMVPGDMRGKVFSQLESLIAQNGNRLDTGFVSTPYLMDVLCENGRADLAYQLLFQEQCPSWLYEVNQGATTIWEAWQAVMPDGHVTDVSFNHYAFGCVGRWLYKTIAGIGAGAPGYRHIVISPQPDERLTYAGAKYESVYGLIASRWALKDGAMQMTVQVPPNTTARVQLPWAEAAEVRESGGALTDRNDITGVTQQPGGTQLIIGSGRYHFTYPYHNQS